MATYSATNYTKKPEAAHGFGGNMKAYYWEVATTAALTTSDVLNFGYVPANFRVLGATLEATDVDTNGTPTIAMNIGDSGSATRYFSGSTVGQAGTASAASAVAGLHYLNTARTLIVGAPSANAATGVAGTWYLSIWGIIEDASTS